MMKRRTVKALVCAAIMAVSLSATACGASKEAANTAAEEEAPVGEEAPVEEEAPAEEEAPVEEEASAEEESSSQKTLEDFLKEDPTAEKQLQEQAAAQGDDQMDMSIEIKGNEVICVATFKEDVELPEGTADTLSATLEQMGSAFSGLAGTLDDMIGAEKGTVSYGVRYCDASGDVLAEASFRAE